MEWRRERLRRELLARERMRLRASDAKGCRLPDCRCSPHVGPAMASCTFGSSCSSEYLAGASTTEESVLVVFGHCLPQDICWIAADRLLYLSTEFRKVQLLGRSAARGSQRGLGNLQHFVSSTSICVIGIVLLVGFVHA